MLILLGALNLRATLRTVRTATEDHHEHPHRHGDYIHTHKHGHSPGAHGHAEEDVPPAKLDRRFGALRFYQTLRPILIGIVHGLAGSAAIALLVLPIIRDPSWAMAYLLIFGIGTIAGMMLITAAIAVPVTYSARFQLLHRHLGTAAGVISLWVWFVPRLSNRFRRRLISLGQPACHEKIVAAVVGNAVGDADNYWRPLRIGRALRGSQTRRERRVFLFEVRILSSANRKRLRSGFLRQRKFCSTWPRTIFPRRDIWNGLES